ncbi:hypothetical protein TrRE_jg6303 [Triparma retinervis]|uniref:Aminotransferase class V domain-containing protein n=1 Tax=Triparma retinervis TaxID=2557542 RepID=A0A9W6ZBS1_9STRA|nr:hypothetical protein TrRE_jg6303 [Triparma retinervis]
MKAALTRLCYLQPMVYHRSVVPRLVEDSRRCACDLIGLEEGLRSTFSFVPVTSAIFQVLQAFDWKPGDVVVTTDVIYHSVKDALLYLQEEKGVVWKISETKFGSTCESRGSAFNSLVSSLVTSSSPVKLAILDAVSSKPTLTFPVPSVVSHCRNLGVPTLVDAAHAPGTRGGERHFDGGATFWVCTFHKWLGVPRGGAGGMEKRGWNEEWKGVRREGEKVYGDVLGLGGGGWRVDEELPVSCLELPEKLKGKGGWEEVKKRLVKILWEEFSIEVPVFLHGGKCGLRVTVSDSVLVSDYARLALAVRVVMERGEFQ